MGSIDWKLLVDLGTLFSVLVALAGLVVTMRTFRRQTNVQLFLAFTDRYDSIIRSFPPDARKARLDAKNEPLPDSEQLRAAILRYLNLCSEEYHLYRHGYLSRTVWEMWEPQIKRTLRSRMFRRAWPDLEDEFIDHPHFVAYVRAVQAEEKG
jgi:hypothetical protein